MNIQHYYRSAANVSLNGSLAAFVPVALIIAASLFFSFRIPLILIAILPFCVYSFFCYQSFLVQQRRSTEAEEAVLSITALKEAENVLMTFLPAPSLRMLLFDPNGNMIGEVKDVKFGWWRWFLPYFLDRLFPGVYQLTDSENKLLASYRINKRKRTVKIFDAEKNELGFYQLDANSRFALTQLGTIHSLGNENMMNVEMSSLYPNMKFRDNQGIIISKLTKGWMPQDWSKYFRDANTPILMFDQKMTETDKILILGVMVDFFQYTSH